MGQVAGLDVAPSQSKREHRERGGNGEQDNGGFSRHGASPLLLGKQWISSNSKCLIWINRKDPPPLAGGLIQIKAVSEFRSK
jgi:hypothetical protein